MRNNIEANKVWVGYCWDNADWVYTHNGDILKPSEVVKIGTGDIVIIIKLNTIYKYRKKKWFKGSLKNLPYKASVMIEFITDIKIK